MSRSQIARFTSARDFISATRRRSGWFLENLTARKALNLAACGASYLLGRETVPAWPTVVKIDISPLCNLRCTVCVHARPTADDPSPPRFNRSQMMSLDAYQRIIDEIAGRSTAVSLYYLGDPLMHPQLDEMCARAMSAGLNSHVSTNFSFRLPDERMLSLVTSGLTHLTVCVDGLTQEAYARTRVGGNIELVLSNLKRLVALRDSLGRVYPRVEVQYIKFQHNVEQLSAALELFERLGIDQVTDFWGSLRTTQEARPERYTRLGPKPAGARPLCFWPHFSMVIKWNGDVIPCCTYRHHAQYAPGEDPRAVGNVFRSSVYDVWNSAEYRALRRQVRNPAAAASDPERPPSFCDGCPTLYDVAETDSRLSADRVRWEDRFEYDERGHVMPITRAGRTLPVIPVESIVVG